MDLKAKLAILADAAKYDASCASSGAKRSAPKQGLGNTQGMGICHSYTPDGRCISLLKILLTNFCIFDCTYCINRVSSDVPRARFSVEDVVWLTLEFYKRNYIEGLFLSSGVLRTPDQTMEEMIEIARRLREIHRFGGYIHLKAVAGASPALIQKAGLWADRLSANIELPTEADLASLAPAKSHDAIEATMDTIKVELDQVAEDKRLKKRAKRFAPGGQSTQMIVGASASSDHDILTTASHLYDSYGLRRVYYSAFSPIPKGDPRLPLKAPPLLREQRLYQADWLLRFYGFEAHELVNTKNPQLDLDTDPKSAWALRHREEFPVDVNRASREQLLRVPGFGLKTVERILSTRAHRAITLADLVKMKAVLDKARFFIKTADQNPDLLSLDTLSLSQKIRKPKVQQPTLFEFMGVEPGVF